MMEKFKKILQICFVFVLGFVLISLTACGKETKEPTPTEQTVEKSETPVETTVETTGDVLDKIKFDDLTVDYDGEAHSIEVSNLPEGATVTYKGNEKKIPGTYEVTATITYGEVTITKTATLTIQMLKSVLTADSVQTIVLSGKDIMPTYTLNNDKQVLTFVVKKDGVVTNLDALYQYGTYEIEMFAASKFGYEESNHVFVTVNIVESLFGLSFDSAEYTYDGSIKGVYVDGTLPTGYSISYVNNEGVEAGYYLASANVLDSNNKVVETLTAVLNIENPENEEFAAYLDEFFIEYLEGDQLAVNIFCEDAESFGLERYDAVWYTYETITDEDIAHDLAIFEEMLADLEVYKDARLSDLQEVAYRNVESFLTENIYEYNLKDSFFMRMLYVDQFGGYVADFGTYMESYSLREEADVIDVVNYIKSTKTAFPSYLTYISEKTEKGYALSDYTITEMRNYLAEILGITEDETVAQTEETQEPYYLVDIISARIDAVDFLTDAQKASYKAQVAKEMEESFMIGVEELYNGLKGYIGKLAPADQGYLTTYENGKEYYLYQLDSLLGINDFDTEEYITELEEYFDEKMADLINLQSQIIMKNPSIKTYADLEKYLESKTICDGTPLEMIDYLKEFAKTIAPELKSNPEIYVKEMDEASAKVSNAVAYYMKSAIDNTGGEYITLNPTKLGGKNDVLSTMAHEGYPGHLYAYVYSKELGLSNLSTIMTSTAHGEGWATYVSIKLFEYASKNSADMDYKNVMGYYIANEETGHILETILDFGIHYQGWTVSEVATFLDVNGYSADAAQEIFDLLIEMPATYAAYGYGKLYFTKIHNEAQEILGKHYNEIEFNAMVLSKGWTNLGELENTYTEYMIKKCHEVGVEFNY